VFEAALADINRCSAALRRLVHLHQQLKAPTLAIVMAVAFARAAALLWPHHRYQARQLLLGGMPRLQSLTRLLPSIREATQPFAAHRALVEAVAEVLEALREDAAAADIAARLSAATAPLVA